MAQRNVAIAEKAHFEIRRHYRTAVEVAFTGVENISRALIHCYGGKPDPGPGQEEALRLLSQRLQGDEKTAFDKAIDKVANITKRKMAFPYRVQYVSTNNVQIRPLDEEETKQILESASNVVELFKQIIINNFSTEIPELQKIARPRRSSSTNT